MADGTFLVQLAQSGISLSAAFRPPCFDIAGGMPQILDCVHRSGMRLGLLVSETKVVRKADPLSWHVEISLFYLEVTVRIAVTKIEVDDFGTGAANKMARAFDASCISRVRGRAFSSGRTWSASHQSPTLRVQRVCGERVHRKVRDAPEYGLGCSVVSVRKLGFRTCARVARISKHLSSPRPVHPCLGRTVRRDQGDMVRCGHIVDLRPSSASPNLGVGFVRT